MPSRDILVVIDNEASVKRRLTPVAALAQRGATSVTGMYVTGLPATQAFADLDGWAQLYDAYMTAQHAEALRAERAFRAELARLQLAGDWHCREADMTEGSSPWRGSTIWSSWARSTPTRRRTWCGRATWRSPRAGRP